MTKMFFVGLIKESEMMLASYEANDIVTNSWKNPLEAWRTAEAIWSDKRRKQTKHSAHDHFSWTMLASESASGYRTRGDLRVAVQEEAEGQDRR